MDNNTNESLIIIGKSCITPLKQTYIYKGKIVKQYPLIVKTVSQKQNTSSCYKQTTISKGKIIK